MNVNSVLLVLTIGSACFLPFAADPPTGGVHGNEGSHRKGEQGGKPEATPIIVGPVSLSELFENMAHKREFGERLSEGGGPVNANLNKAFKACSVLIIDTKKMEDGAWRIDLGLDPRVVLQGKMFFELPGQSGKDFNVSIDGIDFIDIQANEKNELRRVRLFVSLRTSPYRVKLGNGGAFGKSQIFTFTTRPLLWNVKGKLSWED